jgi:hypothetical protein
MSRSSLYFVIGALTVAVIVLAVFFYQQSQQRPGIEIRVNEQGVSIDGNG